jgi:hypothetical protein
VLAYGESAKNWSGWGDTVLVPACSSTVTVYSGTAFSITDYDMIRVVCHANDTCHAGFASDSIYIRWGYQTFSLCLNTSGLYDTCYSPRVVVDTINFDSSSYGTMAVLTLDGDMVANSPGLQVDTSSCSGWATQSKTFSPEWDVYARLWVQGITNNQDAAPLKLMFTVIRRLYQGVGVK